MLVQIGILFIVLQSSYCAERYDGHKVLEILHKAEADYMKILEMELKYKLDFWKLPKHVNDSMKVRVSPQYLEAFLHELEAIDADVSTMIENVQDLIIDEQMHSQVPVHPNRRASARNSGWNLSVYYSHTSINNYMANISASTLPNNIIATVENLGSTHEGRDVRMIKLSKSGSASNKRRIFIDGGIHAREWVSPATVLYIIEHLAHNPNNDASINTLMDRYDVYLAPVLNPDGYQYTNTQRLWRKNRRNNPQGNCFGVDLNRNFPFQWNPNNGGSNSACSDLYSGPTSGSEPETQNVVNYLSANGALFDAYITIHSYGQMWLYPWGYTSALPSDWSDLHSAAQSGLNAIAAYEGINYLLGSSTNVLYAAAGGSDDYAKGGAGIKYSYTIELRDTGTYGFQLPASLILPTAKEFFDGFLAFSETMYTQLYGRS